MTVAFPRAGIAGLAGLAILASVARASEPATAAIEPIRVAQGPTPRSATATGRARTAPKSPVQVFRASCMECHDVDGRGEAIRDVFPKIPDFTDPGWQDSRSDADLSRSILDGKGKSMPRMKSKLGTLDVGRMVAFVRAFRGGKQVVEDEPEESPTPLPPQPVALSPSTRTDPRVQEGGRLYQQFCARCHGPDGRGTGMRASLPAIPDFTRPAWQDGRNDPQLVVSILDGKGTGMPSFRGKVGDGPAHDLVAFIRAFGPSRPRPADNAFADFEARFRQLQQEFEDLGRQIQALTATRQP